MPVSRKPKALCLRCGAAKATPWATCRRCKFNPEGDEDALVKSVYLSEGRFEDPDEQERYRTELQHMAEELSAGHPIIFEPDELRRLLEQKRLVESIRPAAAFKALFKYFLPVILFVVVLWGLVFTVRYLHRRSRERRHLSVAAELLRPAERDIEFRRPV
jgi:hypothetical protein